MGHDCTVRFANDMGDYYVINLTVYYKTSSGGDTVHSEDIRIKGPGYSTLTFNYLVKVYSTGMGTAHVNLDSKKFDGRPATAYFTTRGEAVGDWAAYFLDWESAGEKINRYQYG